MDSDGKVEEHQWTKADLIAEPSPSSPGGGKVAIDPENPSSVPERYRGTMVRAAERLSAKAINTPAGAYTTEDGVLQMLTDLLALARNDGCVAAAWAFEQLTAVPSPSSPGELVMGQEVRVKAVYYSPGNIPGRCVVSIDAHSVYPDTQGSVAMSVPLSSLSTVGSEVKRG